MSWTISLDRKPSPRFISETLTAHHLDSAQCWMVGDSAADLGAGLAAGIPVALVRTGRLNPDCYPELSTHQVPVFDRLDDFIATLE
jgi:phosphoglycolate phosphatase-like HAD superfamily hydrolase